MLQVLGTPAYTCKPPSQNSFEDVELPVSMEIAGIVTALFLANTGPT